MTILVTGGAGFIGVNFILDWLADLGELVINVDALTYAGNLSSLASIANDRNYRFEHTDICNEDAVRDILKRHQPRAIIHFAAESHVDRSIHGPRAFLRTNVQGTFSLLQVTYDYWRLLPSRVKQAFRFVQVSTDEVYGSLGVEDLPFTETTPFAPNSPYSASKAGADHFARAWNHTFDFPCIVTHCSNNYGPFQFPEKLVPLVISNALAGEVLPIYGDGLNVRDWIHVRDHCAALRRILQTGTPGESYNIGGRSELTNIDLVRKICSILDRLRPRDNGRYDELISYVQDRAGHDRRYAIDNTKIEREIGWQPSETIETGLEKTVAWYLSNTKWVENTKTGAYREWINHNYKVASAERVA
jgi:dTDP-glucose 4,6-dehydratase